jgi:hypothetical protein
MSDKNEDGLIPGQEVDFATVQRINSERTQRQAAPEEVKPEVKRGRPAKVKPDE